MGAGSFENLHCAAFVGWAEGRTALSVRVRVRVDEAVLVVALICGALEFDEKSV